METVSFFNKLNQIDYDHNLAVVEAKNKHQKALIRIYAHKHNLEYRYYHYDKFKMVTFYRCKECKEKTTHKKMIWITDYSVISGDPIGCYARCPECWDNIYYPEYGPKDEDNKEQFTVWSPANAVIIGRNLGKYTRKRPDRTSRKKKGDLTWRLDYLRNAINSLKDNKLSIISI